MYILNGKMLKDEESISPLSEGFMFGYGVFETLKIIEGKIIFFDDHLERLIKGCETLGIKVEVSHQQIKKDSYRLLKANDMKNDVLKILYSKNKDDVYLLLTTRQNPYTEEDYKKGFKLTISDIRRNQHSILPYIKSNNYIENLIENKKAKEKGFNEVIFLNTDNFMAEGSVSNIFWIKDGEVFTPSVDCGLLPGIVREKVILCSNNIGLKVNEGKFSEEELIKSDEVFITNSIMDIMPVSSILNNEYSINENNITKSIIESYNRILGE